MSDNEDPRWAEDPLEAAAKVQRLYDSDVPFFTKDRIREAYKSLQENNEPGKKAYTRDLDGKLESFKIETGEVFPDPDDDLKWIGYPILYYVSIQHLLDQEWLGGNSPYSNLRIVHCLERCDEPAEEIDQQIKHESLQRAIDTWRDSQSWEQLKKALSGVSLPPVKKFVAFALSSMPAFSDVPRDNRSLFQHALLVTLRDLLLESSTQEHDGIKCYAQDPAYTERDIAVLQSCGVTVLPDPEGFLEVDEETAVISISPNVPVKQVVSELARPALIIWNTIKGNGLEETPTTDPDSPRLQKWINEHYETLEFPPEPELFGQLAVYARRT
ncbi:hypothetical protein BJX66DRAFT_314426 [Aspergillus keveii]|uniref:SRR1-like domain-containing protein n=1 Tax=Aspergillus keveii TaxID=714993 RepID=A0ABR4FQW2_9EURO